MEQPERSFPFAPPHIPSSLPRCVMQAPSRRRRCREGDGPLPAGPPREVSSHGAGVGAKRGLAGPPTGPGPCAPLRGATGLLCPGAARAVPPAPGLSRGRALSSCPGAAVGAARRGKACPGLLPAAALGPGLASDLALAEADMFWALWQLRQSAIFSSPVSCLTLFSVPG